jgi:group I intron endonuclease
MGNKPYGVIYRITNLINGKMYIGQTINKKPDIRFSQHKIDSNKEYPKTLIGRAIKKHGKENFIFQIICLCYSQFELNFKEEFFIKKYKSLSSENGYNLLSYQNGRGIVSQETKDKISKDYKTNYIKQQSTISTGRKNRGVKKKRNKKYVGVYKRFDKYISLICLDCKNICLGTYKVEENAAKAYDIKAIELYGENANLNFPELRDDYIKGNIKVYKEQKSNSGIKGLLFVKRENNWKAVNYFGDIQSCKHFKNKEDAIEQLIKWHPEGKLEYF